MNLDAWAVIASSACLVIVLLTAVWDRRDRNG